MEAPIIPGTRIECYKGKYIEAMERHAILRLLNRKPLHYTTKERSVGMPHFLGTGQKITRFYKGSGATIITKGVELQQQLTHP